MTAVGLVAVGEEIGGGEPVFFGVGALGGGVFREDVGLEIDGRAGREGVQVGGFVGVGDDGDFDAREVRGEVSRDGEADAVYGDGALRDDLRGELIGELEGETPVGGVEVGVKREDGEEFSGRVDVALDDVAAEG